jgi:hypothetical protein
VTFELVPPAPDSQLRAVGAALAATGLNLDPAPAAYASAWRRAAAEEGAASAEDSYAGVAPASPSRHDADSERSSPTLV